MRRIKTAIVGCGMISDIYIKNCIHLFSVIDLAAVCNRSEAAAKEKSEFYKIPAKTFEEVLMDASIEMVINLTGPAAHYDVIKRCLMAGKHVFTEKMLCTDMTQGKELLRLAEEKRKYLGAAPDTFLGAGLQTARFAIDSGWIGTVTSCRAAVNLSQALNSELYGYIKNAGGGFAYDVGVYYVTAILSLLGPVKKVTGFKAETKEHNGELFYAGNYGKHWKTADDHLYAGSFLFKNGVVGTLHLDGESIDDEQSSLVIYGTEGILSLGDPNRFDGEVRLLRSGSAPCVLPFTHGYCGTPLYGEHTAVDYGQHRGVGAAEMAWAIQKERPHRASKELGLHTMEVLTGLDQSAQKGIVYEMQTTFQRPKALPSGYMGTRMKGSMRGDSEMSLVD